MMPSPAIRALLDSVSAFLQSVEWNDRSSEEGAADLVTRIDEVLEAPIPEARGAWQPIATAPARRKVFVSWVNELGKQRTTLATFYLAGTLELDEVPEDMLNEDGTNAEDGWWECREAGDAEDWHLNERLTHWMPLPAPPSDALSPPQPECKRCGGSELDTYVDSAQPSGYRERACPACSPPQPRPIDAVEFAITALTNMGVDMTCGACAEVAFTGMTTNQHTCSPPQPSAPCSKCGEAFIVTETHWTTCPKCRPTSPQPRSGEGENEAETAVLLAQAEQWLDDFGGYRYGDKGLREQMEGATTLIRLLRQQLAEAQKERYQWNTFWFTPAELVQLLGTHFNRANEAEALVLTLTQQRADAEVAEGRAKLLATQLEVSLTAARGEVLTLTKERDDAQDQCADHMRGENSALNEIAILTERMEEATRQREMWRKAAMTADKDVAALTEERTRLHAEKERIQREFADDLADREGNLYEQIKDLVEHCHVITEAKEDAERERDDLRTAISRDLTGHKAIVALAEAHRQDSEDVDSYLRAKEDAERRLQQAEQERAKPI